MRLASGARRCAQGAPQRPPPHPTPAAPAQDGVLCNSEEVSRLAACEVMAELYGLTVHPDEFIPFTGTGEANFLGEGPHAGGQASRPAARQTVGGASRQACGGREARREAGSVWAPHEPPGTCACACLRRSYGCWPPAQAAWRPSMARPLSWSHARPSSSRQALGAARRGSPLPNRCRCCLLEEITWAHRPAATRQRCPSEKLLGFHTWAGPAAAVAGKVGVRSRDHHAGAASAPAADLHGKVCEARHGHWARGGAAARGGVPGSGPEDCCGLQRRSGQGG